MERFLVRSQPPIVDLTAELEPAAAPRASEPCIAAAVDVTPVVRKRFLPGGILEPSLLEQVEAIAQQANCVGCDGRGLAEAIARALPYGCTYRERRRQPPSNKFALPQDRATPGTIAVRRPPNTRPGKPAVISMFAQWEMGAAGKYYRVKPPEGTPPDSALNRERWFEECLERIGKLDPPFRSIAFPSEIGCGLAGGSWPKYEAMIAQFALRHPHIEVNVVKWTGGGHRGRDAQQRGAPSGACFKCGAAGHWAARCPTTGKGRSVKG